MPGQWGWTGAHPLGHNVGTVQHLAGMEGARGRLRDPRSWRAFAPWAHGHGSSQVRTGHSWAQTACVQPQGRLVVTTISAIPTWLCLCGTRLVPVHLWAAVMGWDGWKRGHHRSAQHGAHSRAVLEVLPRTAGGGGGLPRAGDLGLDWRPWSLGPTFWGAGLELSAVSVLWEGMIASSTFCIS